jgi:hypothetical protein
MDEFNVGDKVKRISTSATLKTGEIYEVCMVSGYEQNN